MTKPKIAFICTHNACRSQIAEALGKKLADDVFESYSAGTAIKNQINPDAVRLMKKSMALICKHQDNLTRRLTHYQPLTVSLPWAAA